MTISELISELGGARHIAQALGITPAAVHNWRSLGAIPPTHYIALSRLSRRRIDPDLFKVLPEAKRAYGGEGRDDPSAG